MKVILVCTLCCACLFSMIILKERQHSVYMYPADIRIWWHVNLFTLIAGLKISEYVGKSSFLAREFQGMGWITVALFFALYFANQRGLMPNPQYQTYIFSGTCLVFLIAIGIAGYKHDLLNDEDE